MDIDNVEYVLGLELVFLIPDSGVLPVEITNILQIEPTKSWEKGDPHGSRKWRYPHNGWILESGEDDRNSSIKQQYDALHRILFPKMKNFSNLPDDLSWHISCYVTARKYMPGIDFKNSQLKFISEIGCGLDIDIHDHRNLEPIEIESD